MPFTFYCAAKTQNKYSERPALFFASNLPSQFWCKVSVHLTLYPAKTTFSPLLHGTPFAKTTGKSLFLYSPQRKPSLQRHSGLFSAVQHPPPASIQSPLSTPLPACPAIKPDTTSESCTSQRKSVKTTEVCEAKNKKKKGSYIQMSQRTIWIVQVLYQEVSRFHQQFTSKILLKEKLTSQFQSWHYCIKNLKIIRRKKVQDCSSIA